MTDKLPDGFAEDWGALKTDIGYIKKKLDKVEPADIANLKKDMALIKRVGGTVVASIGGGLAWAWHKLLNGGN